MMVYLDGNEVGADTISPALHRFIGTFRTPTPPRLTAATWCPCGQVLQVVGEEFKHWQAGHWDVPQYVSIA